SPAIVTPSAVRPVTSPLRVASRVVLSLGVITVLLLTSLIATLNDDRRREIAAAAAAWMSASVLPCGAAVGVAVGLALETAGVPVSASAVPVRPIRTTAAVPRPAVALVKRFMVCSLDWKCGPRLGQRFVSPPLSVLHVSRRVGTVFGMCKPVRHAKIATQRSVCLQARILPWPASLYGLRKDPGPPAAG